MQRIKRTWWAIFGLTSLAWIVMEPAAFTPTGFIAIRNLLVQYSGILAIVWMSVAMVLATRPHWPEHWFGGLDKMYRLHKWLGITALVATVVHWGSANAPKWAIALGLITPSARGPHAMAANPVAAWFQTQRGTAESIGGFVLYPLVILLVVALVSRVPYRLFYKTHRVLAACYLALVFHAVILTTFRYWVSPVGLLLAVSLGAGTWSAIVVLLRRVAHDRRVQGTITSLHIFPGVRSLEVDLAVGAGWHGHEAGQFAFVTSNASEGAHPYTFASAWNATDSRMSFVVKELGDHTDHLRDTLQVGQEVTVEGPYGCFTFADECPDQIWVGGGIGITPFIARMKSLATRATRRPQTIHLFHATADEDPEAFARLSADAVAAGVTLAILVDARDGFLSGPRIRAAVPEWRGSSLWFCGPSGLGAALRRDFATAGMAVDDRFHQELFALR